MLTLKLDFLVAVIHSASFISNFVTELPIQRGIDQCSVAWTGIISVGIPDNRIQSDLELKVFNPTGDEHLKFPWNQRRRTVLIPSWFMNIFSLCFFETSSSTAIQWHATKLVALESVQPDNRNYSFNRSRVPPRTGRTEYTLNATIDDFNAIHELSEFKRPRNRPGNTVHRSSEKVKLSLTMEK